MNKRIVIFQGEKGFGDWPPEDGCRFVEWIGNLANKVPPTLWNSVRFEFGVQSYQDGDNSPTLCVSYERPETPAEIAERERNIADRRAKRTAEEHAEWLRLRAKYGG